MRFRDSIALHTCPLLLRVGLAAAFLWAGIPKWRTTTFEGLAAATLVELGIGNKTVVAGAPAPPTPEKVEEPKQPEPGPQVEPPAVEESPDSAQQPQEQPSSDTERPAEGEGEVNQPAPQSGEQPAAVPAEPSAPPPGQSETRPAAPVEKPVASESSGANVQYKVDAMNVEGITVMLHDVGHPYPRLFAWAAMLTETLGAGLLLIGLFSRVWGLGLAIAMGYAFALTTLPAIQAHVNASAGFLAAFAATDRSVQTGAFFQLMLLIAAWCIFIGGPGAVSLDRLIFRRGDSDE